MARNMYTVHSVTITGVPGEIKRSRDLRGGRCVELDPQLCPEEIMSREVALG